MAEEANQTNIFTVSDFDSDSDFVSNSDFDSDLLSDIGFGYQLETGSMSRRDRSTSKSFIDKLREAIENEDTDLDTITSMIETSGVDVSSVDSQGRTLMSHAIRHRTRQDVFHYLLYEAGAVSTIKDLCSAVYFGKPLDDIKAMINTSAVDVNSREPVEGRTPLWCALYRRHRHLVDYLLHEAGAVPDVTDITTAIATDTELLTIKSMIETSGVDINSMCSVFTECTLPATPLYHAVRENRIDVAEYLLQEAGASVAIRVEIRYLGINGKTPLMAAAECGHSEMCELLLRHGGLCTIDDVDSGDTRRIRRPYAGGQTALMKAVTIGSRRRGNRVVEVLLANNADMTVRDGEGQTAMDKAVKIGADDIVSMLQQEDTRRRAELPTL